MIDTPSLVEDLVRDARWFAQGSGCSWQPLCWMLAAAEHGLRPDIAECLRQLASLTAGAASGMTRILAAMGCLAASLPDRSRLRLLLPLPPLAVCVSTIGYGCLTNWVSVGPGGLRMGEATRCFVTLHLVSVPLSAALFAMLRHVARLRPTPVTLTAGLDVAGMVSPALSLFHSLGATIMILVLSLGVAAALVALEGMLGGRLLRRLKVARHAG